MQFAEAERSNFKSRTTIQADGVELQLSLMDMDGRFTNEQKLERARKAMTAQAQRKLDMIGKISKALGMDVVVHDYMRGSNGYFGEDGKIHFVLSGHMSVARVAAHELTHQMQSVASEKYTVVRDQLIEDVGQDRFDRLLKRKAAQYGYNMESEQGRLACDEEVIAELCEGMLSDKDRLERFAERHTDTALTLKDRLTKILNAIHATLKDTFGQNQNRISDMITDEKTADKWLDGLDEVLKKVQEKQVQENKSAIQYRIDETGMSAERKAEYDEYIQNALGGPGNNNEKQFTIGKVDARVAKWLERFGKKINSDAVHVIADNDVRHIRNRHGIAKEGQYGVTTGDLQAIPYILKNAKEMYFFPKPNGKSGILYVTDGVDTTYYVEEILGEDTLTGKQMIKTKKGTVPSAYENIINNKEAFLAPLDNAADAVPGMYVQDARQYNASANKISQADKYVKGKFLLDEAYRNAVTTGNVQEQQKLVEQAAKEAGYTKLFYHGSKKGGGFTTFKNWQYFTENKQYAQRYAGGENGLYTTYVKMENTFDTRQAEARSLFNEARQELGLSKLQENGLPDWTDGYDLSEYIEENDLPYDSIILDEGGDMVNGKPVSRGLSYVIRNPEQIKSADAVTYDDAGNVIPLSERFNMGKKDIRYALDEVDGTYFVRAEQNLFVKEDGTPYSEREIFNSLVGKTISLPEGDVKIEKALPGKDMYNELYKRRPARSSRVKDLNALNKDVNHNMVELLENSTATTINAEDKEKRHAKNDIVGFDTRTVKFFDGEKAYDIGFSIANMKNGEKVAYAKKFFGYDAAFTKKIQAAEAASDSDLSDAGISPMNQQSEFTDTMTQNGESVKGKFSLDTDAGNLQAELYELKNQRKEMLEADEAYRKASEQRRYANTFAERVAASRALREAQEKIDTAEIDRKISELQDRISKMREEEVRKHREEKEKYAGTKTAGYSMEPDTRLKSLDAPYMEAVKSGNKSKAQKLVQQAAEAAMPKSVVRDSKGKLLKTYHYTNSNFTAFDRSTARTGNEMDGFFFAPDAESTREYGERQIVAYLNITNLAVDPVLDRKFDDSGTLLREKLAAQGYDGVARTENGKIYEYMVFDPEQIKLADAVTYDDAGNVIPLSERFNMGKKDIRYSLDTEQLEKTVRAIDTKALEEGLQSMTLTSNVNSFTMKDPSRFFDAISKNNTELRDELHDIFEKPHSEATGKYARGIKDMQERVRNIATEAGILSKDGKKFDKAASAAVQNIGEGIAPIACSVEAKVVEADTISLKATRKDSEILSGNCTLEA